MWCSLNSLEKDFILYKDFIHLSVYIGTICEHFRQQTDQCSLSYENNINNYWQSSKPEIFVIIVTCHLVQIWIIPLPCYHCWLFCGDVYVCAWTGMQSHCCTETRPPWCTAPSACHGCGPDLVHPDDGDGSCGDAAVAAGSCSIGGVEFWDQHVWRNYYLEVF